MRKERVGILVEGGLDEGSLGVDWGGPKLDVKRTKRDRPGSRCSDAIYRACERIDAGEVDEVFSTRLAIKESMQK